MWLFRLTYMNGMKKAITFVLRLFPLAINLNFLSAQILVLPYFLSLILQIQSSLEAFIFDDMFIAFFENFELNFRQNLRKFLELNFSLNKKLYLFFELCFLTCNMWHIK